jgi:glycosyltransferase involved in cell wall biosynthesis
MKINWFSPLPPARTAIAEYSSDIVAYLGELGEVTMWTDQPTWTKGIEGMAKVRHFSPQSFLNAAPDDAINIFNIGNDARVHGKIWQLSRARPGVVILHDLNLHAFFAELYINHWHDLEGYRMQMEFYYGREGGRRADEYYRQAVKGNAVKYVDAMAADFPLVELGVENAHGVIVHTREESSRLSGALGIPVSYAPLPSSPDVPDHGAEQAAPEAGERIRLVCFGYISHNRCLDKVLLALGALSSRDRFRLDVYGMIWDEPYIRSIIDKLNLKTTVELHGFVDDSMLDEALRRAHLAINLRYPTMGEASASQLRIWGYGLPSLVSETGWYASLDPQAVYHIRPRHEVQGIQEALMAILEDPKAFRAMGRRGREVLDREHQPRMFTDALRALIGRVDACSDNLPQRCAHDGASASVIRQKAAHLPGITSSAKNLFSVKGRHVAKSLLRPAGKGDRGSVTVTRSRRGAIQGAPLAGEGLPAMHMESVHLDELLQYEGTAFVQSVYRAVVHREPTNKEMAREIQKLHAGHVDKIELIAELRRTPEGREINTRIDKLAFSAGLRSVYRLPLVGWAARIAISVLRLPVAQRRQRQFETYTAIQVQRQQDLIDELTRRVADLTRNNGDGPRAGTRTNK